MTAPTQKQLQMMSDLRRGVRLLLDTESGCCRRAHSRYDGYTAHAALTGIRAGWFVLYDDELTLTPRAEDYLRALRED